MCPQNLEINITSDIFLIDPVHDEEDIIESICLIDIQYFSLVKNYG